MTTTYSSFNGMAFGPNEDGAFDIVVADPGADNLLSIVVTDGSSAVTSGYLQPFYTSITLDSDANWSTANAQINAFATDITLDGTIACEVEGMYVYIASSSATLTTANISGFVAYFADLGSAPATRAGVQLHFEGGDVGTGQDAAILIRLEGASAALTNVFQFAGTAAKKPAIFIATNAGGQSGTFLQTHTLGGSQTLALVCNINGSTYMIPLYEAS